MAAFGFEIYSGKKPSWTNLLPETKIEESPEHIEAFFNLMYWRQEMWHNRFVEKQKFPWGSNDYLNNYKFTNVYRELDRSSQWLIQNIILKEHKTDYDLIWKMIVYRMFNNPETFEHIEMPEFKEYKGDRIQKFRDDIVHVREVLGLNPYTNAYLVNTAACPGQKRDDCFGFTVIPEIHKNIIKLVGLINSKTATPESICQFFIDKFPSVSHFMAHELYIDLCYIERYTGKKIFRFDQNDYTNVGPGASLGLRLIFPSLKPKEQINGIYKLRDMASDYLEENYPDFKFLHFDRKKQKYYVDSDCNISLHQIEMWLCEYSKYWKLTIKAGKQRSKFKPQNVNTPNNRHFGIDY